MQEYTKKLVTFLLECEYEDIPEDVIRLAKYHFLDCVGAALAEAATERSKIVQRMFDDFNSIGDCHVIGTEKKLTVENAAFEMGILAHTICFDDSGPSHPSVTIVPALLAMAEKYHCSGKQILAAQVLAYEVFQRLNAVTAEAWEMRKRGWHPTGFFGAVTSAALSSKLLGLDVETTQRAFGIAASLGSGLSMNIGTMGMGLHAGNACKNGIIAACLAKEGFTADPAPLEGRFGLMDALSGRGNYDIAALTKGLGDKFALKDPGITIKPYPNCWAHHKVLQAVLELKEKHGICPEDVKAVYADLQMDKPTYRYLEPKDDLEARYSLGYGIALALLDGELTLKQYEKERIKAADTVAMMRKIVPFEAENTEEQQTVTIEMKDGTVYKNRVLYSKGHPKYAPMSEDEIKDKYRICAGRVFEESVVEKTMEQILNMENLSDLNNLIKMLSK